jgi:hypothetical protein
MPSVDSHFCSPEMNGARVRHLVSLADKSDLPPPDPFWLGLFVASGASLSRRQRLTITVAIGTVGKASMSYTRLNERQLMDGIAANRTALEAAHKYQMALSNRQALPANEAARGALTSSNTRAIEMLEADTKVLEEELVCIGRASKKKAGRRLNRRPAVNGRRRCLRESQKSLGTGGEPAPRWTATGPTSDLRSVAHADDRLA